MFADAEIHVCKTADDVGREAGQRFARIAAAAVDARGKFDVALAGGSTPGTMYSLLAAGAVGGQVDWPKVRVFFGDERDVPPDHPHSNYGMAARTLLNRVNVRQNRVYRIRTELCAERAANEYEQTLRRCFVDATNSFDLVLLGMGSDGHTASLFPGSDALCVHDRWCVSNPMREGNSLRGGGGVSPMPGTRVTLTYPIINRARHIVFLVTGSDKAEALRRVLTGPGDPVALPAQGVQPEDGTLVWMVDERAASLLPPQP